MYVITKNKKFLHSTEGSHPTYTWVESEDQATKFKKDFLAKITADFLNASYSLATGAEREYSVIRKDGKYLVVTNINELTTYKWVDHHWGATRFYYSTIPYAWDKVLNTARFFKADTICASTLPTTSTT